MRKVKEESDLFIRVRGRRQYDHLKRCAVASAKSKIEMIERVMTLVSQEVPENLFPDLLSSGEYVVFWERVFSEHLRKRFFPVLFISILSAVLEEQDRKQICLIHIQLLFDRCFIV